MRLDMKKGADAGNANLVPLGSEPVPLGSAIAELRLDGHAADLALRHLARQPVLGLSRTSEIQKNYVQKNYFNLLHIRAKYPKSILKIV